MEDLNGNPNEVLKEYKDRYMRLPTIPMIQCSGFADERYIAMLKNALNKGRPVNDDDYDKYFPINPDAVY